jgi:hypothetical protein
MSDSGLELYIPWPTFNGLRKDPSVVRHQPQREAYTIAEIFHPGWQYLSKGGRALHARNVHQILGDDVTAPDLVKFVVCWTPGGKRSGGTGQALRLAEHYGVEIIDLAIPESRARVEGFRRAE